MSANLHHLGVIDYCNSHVFGDLRWCKIASINSMSEHRCKWGLEG